MNYYYELDALKEIYLEDSWVLEIQESDNELSFIVEAVLTEKHHLYTKPKDNEQYCYKKAKLTFKNCNSINWINKNLQPSTDASGSIDYGNIDTFIFSEEEHELTGAWGEININSSSVNLEWV